MDDQRVWLKELIGRRLELDVSALADEAEFIGDLGADSLDLIDLALYLEEEFGIEVPQQDVERMSTVGGAVSYVLAVLAQRPTDLEARA